jgi:integrase
MRWAEAIGLEQDYLRLSLINVEWQLHEINGIFHRLPPKDDSYRSTDWDQPSKGRPGRVVIADATQWPGTPAATWPPAEAGTPFTPPRGKGIRVFAEDTPLACWLSIRPGLTPHGLRHGHKTWMAEDGIPEILQALRLGHTVPGMRGVYTHVSDAMRTELKGTLQARWEASLRDRAAISPRSPVPLLDELLTPLRENHAKLISQIPPTTGQDRTRLLG